MARAKANRVQKHFRVDAHTPEKLDRLAIQLGYIYGKGGALGELLDAIANEEVILVPKAAWQRLIGSK
ncbi:MAG: hypothetical protein MUF49_26365 [Oculatellaceae cyanobacterium Prado106]|jgi:hypothetical protein|nr:hypothetical protein [Oculatellaceae cyanobacterium Prado106]